jgi:CHAT domain-containing protein
MALVRLGAGKPGEAVNLLEAAASAESPERAGFLNDLAVAYLARGETLDQTRDFVRALDAAAEAAEIDPAMLEACFNRALALERLQLLTQAVPAWQDCAGRESDPAWKDEINRHVLVLQQLSKPQKADLQAIRTEALEQILPDWGAAFLGGREGEAAASAARGQLSGRILSEKDNDFTVADIFEVILRETGRPSGRSRLADLAKAALLYKDAQGAFASYRCEAGKPWFEEARALFARLESPMGPWAELGAIGCEFYADRFDAVLARLHTLQFNSARFPILAARWHWIKGMAHARQGDLRTSLREVEATVAYFNRTGEWENQGAGYQMLGEAYRLLGDEDEAWRYRVQALTLLRNTPNSRRRLMLLRDAGESLLSEERSHAASLFLGEAVRVASGSNDVRDYAEMLLWHARALAQLGRFESAWLQLQKARQQAAGVEEPNLRERALADIGFAEADLESRRAPERALPLFEEPYAAYRRKGHVLPQATLLLHRARLARSLRLPDRELADLDEGIGLFERQWQSLDQDKDRVSFLGTAQELYDARILHEIERGDPAAALEYSERARAFWTETSGSVDASWIRELSPAPPQPRLCTVAGREALPENVALLEYALAGDRLFSWLIRCNHVRFAVSSASAGQVTDVVRLLRKAAQSGSPERFQELGEIAYDLLLRPAVRDLPPGVALVIVPDKDLHGVPFGALRDRATRRFLVEDREVSIAPSATFFRTALDEPGDLVDPEDALLVNPVNPDLRESGREIEDLRRIYPKSEVLDGSGASREAILSALDEHWLFHYVGHAVVHPVHPFQSYLPLGPEGAEEITLQDFQGRSFRRLDLVVLSACSSIGAAPIRGGGFLGLARPFLSGGVRSVVGTLWDIDDKASRTILTDFHQRLRAGSSPAAALRGAQIGSIRNGGLPSAWAAFTVVGEGAVWTNTSSSRQR